MIKEMFEDVFREVMLFLPIIVALETLAFAVTVFIWSVATLAGLGLLFSVLWKFFAIVALVVAVLALGQVKARGLDRVKPL
jgi:hypothetical protein